MLPRRSFLLALSAALGASLAVPAVATAKAKVEVKTVEWKTASKADAARQKRLSLEIRRAAQRAAKGLDFGKTGRVELSFTVVEVSREDLGDVVRVSCTLVGRVAGGGRARSKLRFGGSPKDTKKVERQVVIAATDGVMTRLSEMARAQQS
jgi:hypothetical protein